MFDILIEFTVSEYRLALRLKGQATNYIHNHKIRAID